MFLFLKPLHLFTPKMKRARAVNINSQPKIMAIVELKNLIEDTPTTTIVKEVRKYAKRVLSMAKSVLSKAK